MPYVDNAVRLHSLECTNPVFEDIYIPLCCHRPRVYWACGFYCPYLKPIAHTHTQHTHTHTHTQDPLEFASLNRAGYSNTHEMLSGTENKVEMCVNCDVQRRPKEIHCAHAQKKKFGPKKRY